MSYEPTNWKTGDVVTSTKLNKLEQGVAGVLKSYPITLNAVGIPTGAEVTPNQLRSAISNGAEVLFSAKISNDNQFTYATYTVTQFMIVDTQTLLRLQSSTETLVFDAETLDSNFVLHKEE